MKFKSKIRGWINIFFCFVFLVLIFLFSFKVSQWGVFGTAQHNLMKNVSGTAQDLFVSEALMPWKQIGIEKTFLEKSVNIPADYACFIVQYINGSLFTSHSKPDSRNHFPGDLYRSRRKHILKMLMAAVNSSISILPFEAAFCLGDCVVSDISGSLSKHVMNGYPKIADPVAVFTPVKCKGSMNIPFPMWDTAMGDFDHWDGVVNKIKTNAARYNWHSKIGKAVFRGGQRTCTIDRGTVKAITGVNTSPNDVRWKVCGRTALLYSALTSNYSNYFDVSLTDGHNFNTVLPSPQSLPTHLDMNLQEKFKHIIYVEGHCQWANRLRRLLFMGSAIIFQDTECVEPYGMLLRPWIHYIPVDYTFSNLTETMLWAMKHDDEVQLIIQRQNEYADRHVSAAAIRTYVRRLFEAYSRLLKYEVHLRHDSIRVTTHCDE